MDIKKYLNFGKYEVKTECLNCSLKQTTYIKKGELADDVIKDYTCSSCGCNKLELLKNRWIKDETKTK